MTVNGLTISDRIINQFLLNCGDHYQAGGLRPVHSARRALFSALKQDYDMMTEIVPRLPALNEQMTRWEIEAQAQAEPA